jgi:type VI secretion system secreted protein VgrG
MYYQERKNFTFVSKGLSEDTFEVVTINGTEAISKPYEFAITLSSEDPDIDLKSVLRNPATLTIMCGDDEIPIHGVPAAFELLNEANHRIFYRALLVPRFWFLGMYSDNRLFLDKTIPQIIEEILNQAGLTSQDYQLKFNRSYAPWEYVCQHRESNLDFLSRWMEREGIYYYFEQTDKAEKLIITDTSSVHKDIQGDATLSYSPASGLIPKDEEIIAEFACRQRVLPKKVILKDYNYRQPSLEVKAEADVDPNGREDVYIYGEHFKAPGEGNELAAIRADEFKCRETMYYGESSSPRLSPGYLFELLEHYRNSCNRKYLVTEVVHRGRESGLLLAGVGQGQTEREQQPGYSNTFVCILSDAQFRPERKTPKPRFHGTMNAVVDAAGDGSTAELDDQGRYKVILPFDMSGRDSGKASRWIRMAQPYSGKTEGAPKPYGTHFPLHKGSEVLLTFIDGDLDRPIISGAVPNPATVSPVVNTNQTQSIIRDNYGNEIILDATPGDEHIRLYSPHHNSGLELGRSSKTWTQSHNNNWAVGNNISATCGNNIGLVGGTSTDIKAGYLSDIKMGYAFDFIGGIKQSVNLALDVKTNLEPVVQSSRKDVLTTAGKDQVITAGDQVCIIGGDSSRTDSVASKYPKLDHIASFFVPTTGTRAQVVKENRSIINVFPEKLSMSVSNKDDTYKIDNKSRSVIVNPLKQKADEIYTKNPPLFAASLPFLISAIVTSISTGVAEGMKPDAEARDEMWFGISTAITAAVSTAILLCFSKAFAGDDAIEPYGHNDPAARIEMNHEGKVNINSKLNSVVVRVGANNAAKMRGTGLRIERDSLLLGRDEDLEATNSANGSRLKMPKTGDIFLVASSDNTIKGKKIYLNGNVFYGPGQNLKVLK